jgi:multidrug efflux pump subunit AcrA (membrane-fusion protein)
VRSVDVVEGQEVAAGQRLFSVERRDDVGNVFRPLVVNARVRGRVSEVLVEVEDAVDRGDPAVVIIGTGEYELEAYVSDKDAFKVQPGRTVTARTTAGSVVRGTLAARSQEPDYETGLFTLTFSFSNHPGMNIGQFLLVDLPVDRERGVFVRRELVIRRYGRYFLWVVGDDQVLEAREVELGPAYGDQVKIERGLEPGERYLTRLTGREREGMPAGGAGD